jgi:hypothetical protein
VERAPGSRAPWTAAGQPDPDYEQGARVVHQMLLTHANLLSGFRGRFPDHRDASYDEMVRLLGYVWDCRFDGTGNVTGYCCASCGQSRAAATTPAERLASGR